MENKFILSALISLLTVAPVLAEEVFICREEQITGFFQDDEGWRIGNFRQPDVTYLITVFDDTAELKQFGSEWSIDDDCSVPSALMVRCNYYDGEFILGRETLKYIRTHIGGYWTSPEMGNLTPTISRGICTRM